MVKKKKETKIEKGKIKPLIKYGMKNTVPRFFYLFFFSKIKVENTTNFLRNKNLSLIRKKIVINFYRHMKNKIRFVKYDKISLRTTCQKNNNLHLNHHGYYPQKYTS